MAATQKNIALFIDGTWNRHRRDRNTNVRKLYEATPVLHEPNRCQVTRYLHGVGTRPWWFQPGDAPGSSRADITQHLKPEMMLALRPFRWLLGGAFGLGTAARIKEAYAFLCSEFQRTRGDRIYLFGFSRGAFAARSLAGFVERVGVLLQDKLEHVEEAYALYESAADPSQSRLAKHLYDVTKQRFPTPEGDAYMPIHFLGVWDTVGALGLPSRASWLTAPFTEYHQTEVPPNIMHARHALALHELRRSFEPLVWSNRNGHPSLQQVWFAGAHADVGGGYKRGETALSDLALCWMTGQAEKHGLHVDRSSGWPQVSAQSPGSLHHEIRGKFALSAPSVRGHLAAQYTDLSDCIGTFFFHTSVQARLNDASLREYRFWRRRVNSALRLVDEHTLERFIETRLLGHAVVE